MQPTAQDETTRSRSRARPLSLLLRGAFGLFRLIMKMVLVICFLLFGLYIGGLLKFANDVTGATLPQSISTADGIVVLTGGSSRIGSALDLLQQKKGQRLLISGVNPRTKVGDIQKINEARQALFDCCVDVERIATNTRGNATESQNWASLNNYSSLIVVTSAYHMPRAMIEYRRAMPDVTLHPYPVPLAELQADDWWKNPEWVRLVVFEYSKYLGARLGDYLSPSTFNSLRATLWP